jgi:hypothetical protein
LLQWFKAALLQSRIDVSDSGRAYNLFNELGGAALGQRITEVNVEQALGFKASKFSRDIRDASSLFTREFNSKGTRSPEQIADAYERANDATYSLTADFRDDVLAAIGLGKISPKKAEEILKTNRIGKEDIAMIRSGRYKKYEPSDAAKKIAPKDRIKAADAAVKRAICASLSFGSLGGRIPASRPCSSSNFGNIGFEKPERTPATSRSIIRNCWALRPLISPEMATNSTRSGDCDGGQFVMSCSGVFANTAHDSRIMQTASAR